MGRIEQADEIEAEEGQLYNAFSCALTSKALRMASVKGITQFYLPPTRLSTNGMSHTAFTL